VDSAVIRGFLPHEEDLERTLRADPGAADLLMRLIQVQAFAGNIDKMNNAVQRLNALRPDFTRLGGFRRAEEEGSSLTD